MLVDLATNGWAVVVDTGRVYVRAPGWKATGAGLTPAQVQQEKEAVRQSLAARVDEQLNRAGAQQFIYAQERAHFAMGGPRSILSLIADGPALAASLRAVGPSAIEPYIEIADDQRDPHTGLKLWDVFRYFRYFWSFPYYSTPGRTLPILVRDAGQPNHPVCGLLCLASPVPKLTVRDSALGLTPTWLEAVVLVLEALAHGPDEALLRALAAVELLGDAAVSRERVAADVGALLKVDVDGGPNVVERRLLSLSQRARGQRVAAARRRLSFDLMEELEAAIRAISVRDLGLTHAQALKNPSRWVAQLGEFAAKARDDWKRSRSLAEPQAEENRRGSQEMTDDEISETAREPLFRKKRAAQLRALLVAWENLRPVEGEDVGDALRRHVLGEGFKWPPEAFQLTGGKYVSQGARSALHHRLSRLMASQVADVSVCGAIPPYGLLLGGKLVTLLALSRGPSALYFQQYCNQVSDIGSKMAAKIVRKPADLIAITTTSFFSVGSSQYNRVRLPPDLGGVGWEHVGQSRGHGTLHFSLETTDLLQDLLHVETGQALITSRFGEGPSERLRKVRDGLLLLGLPADDLLIHGMPRRVYLAEFAPHFSRIGVEGAAKPWRVSGPSVEQTAAFWRARWLGPRLERRPETFDELGRFRREDYLLSKRLKRSGLQQGELALVSGGET
ncbi:Druantia anti-phage system protein DruA [Corallococcus llansteffanensis]|uniref:Druantia anti-phage system protein DruA n=1 Tax=Corallococcus llansteffanensis TaxID=2316731 RepID=UPI00131561FF|nr:Druantia anti-phage system protein DruA [Corallococcus llansteffanensis]